MKENNNPRVLAVWRVRAAAAALCVGAASYALCAGAAMPLCLSSAWMASLAVWPAAALAAVCARRVLLRGGPGRGLCALLAATLLICAAFSYMALVSLVRETLLPLARISFVAQASAAGILLCCISGSRGAPRLAFALRYVLPALLLAFSLRAAGSSGMEGVFPLLGAGAGQTGIAALCMLPAALPALQLCLYPVELEGMNAEIPKAGFFARRLLLGAGAASALLFLLSLCSPYTVIAGKHSFGERMIVLSSGVPREGVIGTLTTLLQAAALALCAVNALLFAAEAAVRALRFKGRGRRKDA